MTHIFTRPHTVAYARAQVIRSLFYNKANNSIITVSVYKQDNFSSLNCRSTPLEYASPLIVNLHILKEISCLTGSFHRYIKRREPGSGFSLFETESLRYPGFVEFDDVNGKVLTYSATDKVYKVFYSTDSTTTFRIPILTTFLSC